MSLLILSANYQRITSILSESGTQNYLHILLKLTELFRTVSITASIYFPSGLTGNTSESFSSCPMVYAKKGLKKQRQSIMNTYCFIPIKCIFIGVPAIRATSCSMIKDLFLCSNRWHNDEFTEYNKVSDAGSYIKDSIYDFIDDSQKVVIVVDCEKFRPL